MTRLSAQAEQDCRDYLQGSLSRDAAEETLHVGGDHADSIRFHPIYFPMGPKEIRCGPVYPTMRRHARAALSTGFQTAASAREKAVIAALAPLSRSISTTLSLYFFGDPDGLEIWGDLAPVVHLTPTADEHHRHHPSGPLIMDTLRMLSRRVRQGRAHQLDFDAEARIRTEAEELVSKACEAAEAALSEARVNARIP